MLSRNPIKTDALQFFKNNRSKLLEGSTIDTLHIHPRANTLSYDFAYQYCIDKNLPLSTIHTIKEHFSKWANAEIEAAISIAM
jgi:hypothetical protein